MTDLKAPDVGADLVWEVKDSFIRYIRSLEDGEIQGRDGAEPAAAPAVGWRFPRVRERADGPLRTLEFRGELRMRAHNGMLLLILMDPWLTFSDDATTLSVVDLMHWPDRARRQVLARGPSLGRSVPASGEVRIPLSLVEDAVELFNGVYPPGTELAPACLVRQGLL